MTMGAIITDITALVTGSVAWAGSFVTFITSNPLVLLFTITSFVGLGIGLIKRACR